MGSTAAALKAIAFQMADDLPEFGQDLASLPKESLGLSSGDPVQIWKNVVENAFKYTLASEPLYWVIDALDECADPKLLVDSLKALAMSSASIRVLVVSRQAGPIAASLNRLSHSISVVHSEASGRSKNIGDIEVLIDQELVHMHGSQEFLRGLKQDVLLRSSGNFLWTKLVLNEIMGCHTEGSTQEVLNEIPDDIFDLYQRMENSIFKATRRSNITLVKAVLEWTICSHRPLSLNELSQALHPEFTGILDLEKTINDICGQFVQVSQQGNINILHHTTREYFIRTPESQLFVEEEKTHSNLFRKTIQALSYPDLRPTLTQHQHEVQSSRPFAFYSAINWCFHLKRSTHSDVEMLEALVDFFKSPFVLSWIHILSLMKRVDILVEAAEVLTAVVTNGTNRHTFWEASCNTTAGLRLLKDWATDLTKLVGKFGHMLVIAPEIIYDVVPALCPGQTAISNRKADSTISSLQVSGLEDTRWTDNLGCFSLPPLAHGAVSFCCRGKTLAILGLRGTVYLWNTSNFMELVPIDHGSPVTTMALNLSGTRLVTSGLRETKVFDIASQDMLFSIPSPLHTRALCVSFAANDRKVLMGGDDKMVRYASCDPPDMEWQTVHSDLLNETPLDGTFTGSPLSLQLNEDNTLIAAAFRGAPLSVWRLADGRCINKCGRAKDFLSSSGDGRSPKNWSPVDVFTWNAMSGYILGLYRGESLFKWHPLTGEAFEAQHTATDIAASPNGRLFATSTSYGLIRIWDFASFEPIYHLSMEDLTKGLSFSPNGRRFYSLGLNTVYAWEPGSRAHLWKSNPDLVEFNSEIQLQQRGSRISQEQSSAFEAITAMAVAPGGRSYCAGYEDGRVLLFRDDNREGDTLLQFHNSFNVTHIVWSPDGRYVAAADLAGETQFVSLAADPGKGSKPDSFPKSQLDPKNRNIRQMFFSPDEKFLLISTMNSCFVWSLSLSKLQASLELNFLRYPKLLPHPLDIDLLFSCSLHDMIVFRWTNLKIEERIPFILEYDVSRTLPHPSAEEQGIGEYLTVGQKHFTIGLGNSKSGPKCQDRTHLLLALTHHTMAAQFYETVWVSNLSSWVPGTSKNQGINFERIPVGLSDHIRLVLGIISGSKLIFLDQDLWVCAFTLGHSSPTRELCQRYYFIPRDWVVEESLRNCALAEDGTLFWPRDDRVVRIRCDFDLARPITVLQ